MNTDFLPLTTEDQDRIYKEGKITLLRKPTERASFKFSRYLTTRGARR